MSNKKNFISVNAKYYKASEINRIANHNARLSRIDYLLDDKDIEWENIDIIYSKATPDQKAPFMVSGGTFDNIKRSLKSQKPNYKHLAKLLKDEFSLQQEQKQQIQKAKGYYGKGGKENELVEMVVAISEDMAIQYLNQGVNIAQGFHQFAQDLKEKYGFEPLSVSVHFDEGHKKNDIVKYNIHAHITLHNFDFKTGKSVLRKLKKKDFSSMQDLAQKSFQSVGLDFIRGENKELTGKQHLERNAYILQQQTKEIQGLEVDLKTKQNELSHINNRYSVLNKTIQTKHIQTQEASQEFEAINEKLTTLKNELQKVEISIDNSSQWEVQTKKDIKAYLLQNTTKKDKLYYINNINTFYNDMFDMVNFVSNMDVKISELDNLKTINEQLNQRLINFNFTAQTDKNKLSNENKSLNNSLEKYKEAYNKLSIELKSEQTKASEAEEKNTIFTSFIESQKLSDKLRVFVQSRDTADIDRP